jgi:hypothetical protein
MLVIYPSNRERPPSQTTTARVVPTPPPLTPAPVAEAEAITRIVTPVIIVLLATMMIRAVIRAVTTAAMADLTERLPYPTLYPLVGNEPPSRMSLETGISRPCRIFR